MERSISKVGPCPAFLGGMREKAWMDGERGADPNEVGEQENKKNGEALCHFWALNSSRPRSQVEVKVF